MTTENHEAGTYETPDDVKDIGGYVTRWLAAIELSGTEEKEWRQVASEALRVYNAEKDGGGSGTAYNIYYANTETLVPALYNSTPVPDVRRRFGDKDPAAKAGGDIIERALSYLVDEYDFDDLMERAVLHFATTGRGVARVHYEAQEVDTGMIGPEGNPVMDKGAERVWCSLVPWSDFRRGPARSWDDVPWIAFRHHMTREQLQEINPDLGATVKLDATLMDSGDSDESKPEADVFKRAVVWEIWERTTGRMIWIAEALKTEPLQVTDDPLGLRNFYPIARPMQNSRGDDTLVPLCTYKIQKPLLDELDTIAKRIRSLIAQLRPRALGPDNVDVAAWAAADDGQIVGLSDIMAFIDTGGVDKLLAWFPMEPNILAIRALSERLEAVKLALFEVSGLADIMRGQSNSSETLGAQQIKTQWGSLRIQRQQQEVQRFARDLLRMKAELVAEKFMPANIAAMTGLAMEDEAMRVITDDKMRGYRIDIETDSTIRGDLTRNMEQMTQFMAGTAQFMQGIPLAAQAGIPVDALMTIFGAFARNFKLGKEVESVLEGLPEAMKQQAQQAQGKPSPEAMKAEGEAKKLQMDMEAAKAKAMLEMEKGKAELAMKAQEGQMDMEIKKADLGLKGMEMQMKREEMGMKAEAAQMDHAMKMKQGMQSHAVKMQQTVEQARVKAATSPKASN